MVNVDNGDTPLFGRISNITDIDGYAGPGYYGYRPFGYHRFRHPYYGQIGYRDYGYSEYMEYLDVTLVLDVYDVSSGELIWRGWANKDLARHPTPKDVRKFVDKSVRKMLKKFPPLDT